jgi:hypothetical protein
MPGSLAAECNRYVAGAGGEHVDHAVECPRGCRRPRLGKQRRR